MTRKNQRRAGILLRHAMGKVQTGLTHIEVNNTTDKEEMTRNKDVEDAYHDKIRRKFSQTPNTPLMHV